MRGFIRPGRTASTRSVRGTADRALPLLQERVKITLGLADFRVFEYVGEYEPQPLYLKSRYLPDGFPNRDAQLRFDAQLAALGLFDLSGFGPTRGELDAGMDAAKLRVRGFRVVKGGGR